MEIFDVLVIYLFIFTSLKDDSMLENNVKCVTSAIQKTVNMPDNTVTETRVRIPSCHQKCY